MNNSSTLFALVDCNNFYASCERVFNPKLWGKPIIVLSGNDGCVIARSNESKKLGIGMGQPYFQIQNLIRQHKVNIFSSNFVLYGDMSDRVMTILLSSAPSVEIYSIDEAFLDFSGFDFLGKNSDNLYASENYAQELVKKIYQWTGLPVSVGLAPSKTLAKLANYWVKKHATPGSVLDISDYHLQERILPKIDVSEVWGIGRAWTDKLRKLGIQTAWDLRNAEPDNIGRRFNRVLKDTVLELRGSSQIELETVANLRKQIIVSRSFGKKIMSLADIKSALAAHVTTAGERLRNEGLSTKTLMVFLQTSRFIEKTEQYHSHLTVELPAATADTAKLMSTAMEALESIYCLGFSYKKVGVILSSLSLGLQQQGDFFSEDSKENISLMETLDNINQCMGKGTLRYAREGYTKVWQGSKSWCSPRYTTDWLELLKVKAN